MKFGPKFLLTFLWTLFFFFFFFFLLSSILETGIRASMTLLLHCHKSHDTVMVTGYKIAIEESRSRKI